MTPERPEDDHGRGAGAAGSRGSAAALWAAAFVVAAALGFFQRTTGPTYPMRGRAVVGSEELSYRLPRTHGGAGGLVVTVRALDAGSSAVIRWRRYPTAEPYRQVPMLRPSEGVLAGEIPHQPPAGKVEYWIDFEVGGSSARLPAGQTVVARFRGDVPAAALIPHILAMFTSMLLATRALLEVLRPSGPRPYRLILCSMGLLVVGGLILGPIVQQFAFGALWTGWPVGTDLTDNKTLLAVLAWLPATVLALRRRAVASAVMVGWLVMMGVFLIPHSLRGSEIDWTAVPVPTERVSPGP